MIITSHKKTVYKIEMTVLQAQNLQLLLETGRCGHVNELRVAADHGPEIAVDVNETIVALRKALEKR